MKKKLKETKESKAKFGVVKHLYDLIKDKEILFGELELRMWGAELDVGMRRMAGTIRVVDLLANLPKPENEVMEDKQKKIREVFDIMEELTVLEAMDFVAALENAVEKHKYKLMEGKTVADLGIELLEDDK